ncbi:MAG: aquaporin [Phycisphaerales bacterium]|nr:aquaporin [Phycisphaerales bacterium]
MKSNALANCTCEFIGTFALTFIGAGAIVTTAWTGGAPGLVGIALAHGIALSIAVSAAMNISGGHINPAVTVAMLATGRISPGAALQYIIAQCAGASVAGFLLFIVFGMLGSGGGASTGAFAVAEVALGTPNFHERTISAGMAMVVEIGLTFLLVFAVFGTAVDERAPKIGGFGIGLTVCIDILVGGPITGAAMNPARAFGTLVAGGPTTAHLWSQHWVYWLGPITGAIIAAVLYDWLILKPARRKG